VDGIVYAVNSHAAEDIMGTCHRLFLTKLPLGSLDAFHQRKQREQTKRTSANREKEVLS
jgi:hypothetical protein